MEILRVSLWEGATTEDCWPFFQTLKLELRKSSHTTNEFKKFHLQLIASELQAMWRHSGK